VFGGASLTAVRNIVLIGAVGPILIGTYLPRWEPKAGVARWALVVGLAVAAVLGTVELYPVYVVAAVAAATVWMWTRPASMATHGALAAVLAAACLVAVADGRAFQFRAADWKEPAGAANFLRAHGVTGPMFNTYEDGGYLMWRLWPQEKVFADGRALNERVFMDFQRIAYNADATGGKTAAELLDEYGIQVIVMPSFEINNGHPYLLTAALSDPSQKTWKLVYRDAQSVVFMRTPPAGVTPLNSFEALASMEEQCTVYREHGFPACAPALAGLFAQIGDRARAAKWNALAREK
jgi:hypothetical protein